MDAREPATAGRLNQLGDWPSHPVVARRRQRPHFLFLQDRVDDRLWRLTGIDGDDVFLGTGLLERDELALEQRCRHEMVAPLIEPPLDHRRIGLEKDENDVVMPGPEN